MLSFTLSKPRSSGTLSSVMFSESVNFLQDNPLHWLIQSHMAKIPASRGICKLPWSPYVLTLFPKSNSPPKAEFFIKSQSSARQLHHLALCTQADLPLYTAPPRPTHMICELTKDKLCHSPHLSAHLLCFLTNWMKYETVWKSFSFP